ncbi:fimbrial protein [Serratia bockelmannii]|uniref:fimbrial protein n=1 Tax=Serratia bockelmannii TaxID=2703793 RepID=UPI0023625E48|nr:fimbrial protein [Serratia bockelmannii]
MHTMNKDCRVGITALALGGLMLLSLCTPIWAMQVPVNKSPPVPVTFGVRALTPDTPVNPQKAFVSQTLTLPAVACGACAEQDGWTQSWTVSQMTLDKENTRTDHGWYVFNSGLTGIGIGVQVAPAARRTQQGGGRQLPDSGELTVGLVRLGRETGAGLADLPAADFIRTTVFTGTDGLVKYVQQDTLRVSADLRVPTCITTAGSLHFQLPDIGQSWLRRNLAVGEYTDTQASAPQQVVANCSENTRTVRLRFIPNGTTTDSSSGLTTILVGRDENGQETGVGYLMKYDATAFGLTQQGIVHWDRAQPLVLSNPHPADVGDALTQGITVTLQAFYARAKNDKPVTAGQITAKGLYQVTYD